MHLAMVLGALLVTAYVARSALEQVTGALPTVFAILGGIFLLLATVLSVALLFFVRALVRSVEVLSSVLYIPVGRHAPSNYTKGAQGVRGLGSD